MTTEKIDISKPYQAPSAERKARPEAKRPPSSRWQEIEERRDSSKSGALKTEEEKEEKKSNRLTSMKAKNGVVRDWDKEQSPFDLFSSQGTRDGEGDEDLETEISVEEEEDVPVEVAPVNVSVLTAAPVVMETSVVAPLGNPVSSVASASFQNLKLLEFAEKLVKKIVAMKLEGRVEITLTLKNLKLFDGGILKVVEHDSARGQFNLQFSNLNNKAHALVTSSHAETVLKDALASKGYSFHIITATTTEIEPVRAFAAEPGEKGRDGEDESERESQEQG